MRRLLEVHVSWIVSVHWIILVLIFVCHSGLLGQAHDDA